MIRAGEKAQPPLRNGAPVSPDGGPLVQGDALSFACEPGDRIWTVSLDAPAIGVLVIDPESHEATVDGVPVSLPATEQRALAYLHKHRNLLVPYVDLADHLFPGEYPDRLDKAAHNRLSQVISRLRKAIEPGAFTSNGRQAREWRYLTTSHRRGVRLVYGADLASTQIATRTPNNLGAPDPHFVGRTTERWELRRLLQDFRIVTIHGIGGIGKTSLALRAAADMLTVFPGGVWHLNLLALAQDSELEEYAASVIAGGRAGRPPLERLQRALGDRPALLVLDNCEHVAAGARDVIQRLLFRCVNLRVLTTSRRPLWLSGEARLPLQPLTLPGETDPWSRAANPTLLEQDYDAIRLFVRQARSSRADFELNEANAEAIVNICRRLEGVPLALTLAAPHLRLLTVQELERRLDQRLRLLSARHGDAGRHGTMQAAIAWAHDQLSEPARALLARIAVFAGDASLAAVQQVCSFAPVPADSLEQYLEELLDHGLVTATAFQGETRISMLALVHEFAAERLNERAGERDILEARRLAFYRTLVRGSTHSQGSERERARGLLRREGPNLRDALAHARALGNPSAAVELVAGLAEHWIELGFWREATDWLDYAVAELRDDEPADLSAQIFECAGRIAVRMGDLGRAADMLGSNSLASPAASRSTPVNRLSRRPTVRCSPRRSSFTKRVSRMRRSLRSI